MKTSIRLTFLIIVALGVLSGCDKKEVMDNQPANQKPDAEDIQFAIDNLPAGMQVTDTDVNADLFFEKAPTILTFDGYWSIFSVLHLDYQLAVSGCVSAGYSLAVVYWIYDFTEQEWTVTAIKFGECMDADNLDWASVSNFHNDTGSSFYAQGAAQIYIINPQGNKSLWNTYYSEVVYLTH